MKNKVIDVYDLGEKPEKDNFFDFYDILKPISLTGLFNPDSTLFEEFSSIEDTKYLAELYEERKGIVKKEYLEPLTCLLLNFNYTPTLNKYISALKHNEIDIAINYIHGQVNNEQFPINFGFGDEMDEDYKLIEGIDDNEYLRNFKSFKYFQNSSYNSLLRFIESGKFQVCIMGHSCGLSDRTLLNTIFEHDNCRSIKVFYHQKNDEDNYTDIVQNISRHFNYKQKMRGKVVNKTLCQPLPQTQLAKKIKTP